jgi:excinuclease UvrABC helicase subunit UvrB
MGNDKTYENLVVFLKYLSSLDINDGLNSGNKKNDLYFIDITQMNNFFKSLINKSAKKKDFEDLKTELDKELNNCLREERYEDAIRIRDYLKKISKDFI